MNIIAVTIVFRRLAAKTLAGAGCRPARRRARVS
jgi:hypothetical protein